MSARRTIAFVVMLALLAIGLRAQQRDRADGLELRDFQSVWRAADTLYPHFELKGIDWDAVYRRLLPRAQRARGDAIDQVLLDLLAELKDQHVWFQTAPGSERVEPYRTVRSTRDDGAFRLNDSLRSAADGTLRYAMLEGSIGYIHISLFTANARTGFFDALAHLQDSDGLIVDIRHNKGGELNSFIAIAGRFTESTIPSLPTYVLGEHVRSLSRQVAPTGAFQYTRPVVLLINGVTASAGESFAVVMKRFPSVTAIGDTTAGAGAAFFRTVQPDGIIQLSNGRRTWIPTVDLRQYDGTPVEWLGVSPDIHVAQTKEDAERGIDRQLEAAIHFLRNK